MGFHTSESKRLSVDLTAGKEPVGHVNAVNLNADIPDQVNTAESDDPDLTDEEWEAELDECLTPNLTEIQDWSTLCEQIKKGLERK
jgi:hypothetical protein